MPCSSLSTVFFLLVVILASSNEASCKQEKGACEGTKHCFPNSLELEMKHTVQTVHQMVTDTIQRVRSSAALMNNNQVAANQTGLSSGGLSVALSDCIKLYEDSEFRLRRLSGKYGNNDDARTWLSGALTSHRTCLDGLQHYHEMNISHKLVQSDPESVTSHQNLTSLLSRALALYALRNAKKNGTMWRPKLGQNKGLLATWDASTAKADFVVAKDGSGNFKTINEAVAELHRQKRDQGQPPRVVIYVKSGVYSENVEIDRGMKNVMFVGDGIDKTIVTGNKNVIDGATTLSSATFGVSGDGFWARDMTFENTAGPAKEQAVALRVSSDLSAFYRCSFRGYQDTLLLHSQRQFYRDCDIYGTVDYIFGNAAAVLQNCNIFVRKPLHGHGIMITAQGRDDPNENTGISIHGSRVIPDSDFRTVKGLFKSYLGRPWKKYSRTVIFKTDLDGLIDPKGWKEWRGDFALSTLFYGEYMNSGVGASTSNRVNWPGFHVLNRESDVAPFTVGRFIQGDTWLPDTGIPFSTSI
ncbi:hypothetical protein C5167_012870 [Papaver somniferum]|uniref:Pectinesterase n=1 Tax=Papaver somniferum TaxID=3469 RepID=A0A4Y7J1S6_PAPSO|nr:hypothetical protein C5167_012870 [Papaver somniferum]